MFGSKETLVKQLGDEIILGMDIFDVNDIWDVLHNESLEALNAIADQVRLYVIKNYKEGLCYTISFLEEQIRTWIFQFTWRYKVPASGASAPVWRKIKAGERIPVPAYLYKTAFEQKRNFAGKITLEGYLVPNNVPGTICGCDTWYMPVEDIKDLPKE